MNPKQAEALIKRYRKAYPEDSDYAVARRAEQTTARSAIASLAVTICPALTLQGTLDRGDLAFFFLGLGGAVTMALLSFYSWRRSLEFRQVRKLFEDQGPQNFTDLKLEPLKEEHEEFSATNPGH